MRRSRGLTLDELADEAEVSPSHLSRLERSQTLPSFPVLAKIADALGVDVNDFVRLEQDVTELDEHLSFYAGLLALDDELQRELYGLSIEARRQLVERIDQLAHFSRTSTAIQDQVVRAVESGRDDAPFSAVSTLVERSGLDAVSLSRMLLFLDLMNGPRTAVIGGPSLLPIVPGQDLVASYRWAFPVSPIDPAVAQWWMRRTEEIRRNGPLERSIRVIVTSDALQSPLGPVIACSVIDASESCAAAVIAVTERSLGSANLITADGTFGLLEQLAARRGGHDPQHCAVCLSGAQRVGTCVAVVDRLWKSLSSDERDSASALGYLRDVAAQSC